MLDVQMGEILLAMDSWAREAACATSEIPANLFDEPTPTQNKNKVTIGDTVFLTDIPPDVVHLCHACPVKDECVAHAITYGEGDIRGATTKAERDNFFRKNKAS